MLTSAVLVLLMAELASSSVDCPDGAVCPDRSTCCLSQSGYGCCPIPSAVCCPDQIHCCPPSYHCNTGSGMCVREGLPWSRVPFLKKMAAKEPHSPLPRPLESDSLSVLRSAVSVVHCDNLHACPDGTTCCRSPYGQWFCCLFSHGQCCMDGIHCCAFGYHCDPTSTHCLRGSLSVPSAQQIPSLVIKTTEDQCCLSDTGCCMAEFHCDEERRTCVSDTAQLVPLPLGQAIDSALQAGVIRCDDRFNCPAGNTCCKTTTGQWGCCPYRLGQCCMDGKHCCEHKYTCDSTSSKCKGRYTSIPSALKQKAWFI